MPKKPDRPFQAVLFPKTGQVSLNIERTELEQKELERVVARKFASTLSARNLPARLLECNTEEPADAVLMVGKDQEVQVQIVEVVDQYDRELRQLRERITNGFVDQPAVLVAVSGCALVILIACDLIRHPDPSPDFSGLEIRFFQWLESLQPDLHQLEIGKGTQVTLASAPSFLTMTVFISRGAAIDSREFRFVHGGGAALHGRNWLEETIRKKQQMNYATARRPFWLLCYSNFHHVLYDEAILREVCARSSPSIPPFDDVWLFMPFPNQDCGDAHRLEELAMTLPNPSQTPAEIRGKKLATFTPTDSQHWATVKW